MGELSRWQEERSVTKRSDDCWMGGISDEFEADQEKTNKGEDGGPRAEGFGLA